MDKIKLSKLIISYIKLRKMGLFLIATATVIYYTVFCLYKREGEEVFYATAIFLVPFTIFSVNDFLKIYKKHVDLLKCMGLKYFDSCDLPPCDGLLEDDYQRLIQQLCNNRENDILHKNQSYKEMIDFYTMWAHQIKTPISAMSILLQEYDQMDKKQLIQELFKIEQYVEMVLGYNRMSNINNDMCFEQYNLEKMVKQVIRKYSCVFLHKSIKVQLNSLDYTVLTDEKWLVFVIEQLISNSLKYTNKGEIKIYALKDLNTKLFIEDTGIGIRKEDLPRIFEKGFTGNNGRLDKKASGLGLYLCKSILNKLSHKIYIESTIDVGTKVAIEFSDEKNIYV